MEITGKVTKKPVVIGLEINKLYYSGRDEEVIVPDEVEGKQVTEIGNGEASICWENDYKHTGYKSSKLRKIVIPEGVISVNANALNAIYSGAEFVLPSTLKRLGKKCSRGSSPYPAPAGEGGDVAGLSPSPCAL